MMFKYIYRHQRCGILLLPGPQRCKPQDPMTQTLSFFFLTKDAIQKSIFLAAPSTPPPLAADPFKKEFPPGNHVPLCSLRGVECVPPR